MGADPNLNHAGTRGRHGPSAAVHDPANQRGQLDAALAERFREIAYLTLLLRQQEQRHEPQSEEIEWLSRVAGTLLVMPRWWALLPRSSRDRKIHRLLHDQGLFNAEAYRDRNPDVASTGADPLRHYLQYGMKEGRSRFA